MAFNPSSTIYLCNAPIDSTYQHQIYFSSKDQQFSYFYAKRVYALTDYLTVRKNKAGGGVQSSIKVAYNIDDLYKCNYMCYQNANHGTKWFYAFITDLVYVNEKTTEILFETDVWQTWGLDVELQESYVIREHSATDTIGDNVVPEAFSFNDYEMTKFPDGSTGLGEIGYIVTTSETVSNDGTTDLEYGSALFDITGLKQGLFFYYFKPDSAKLHQFLNNLDKDIVVSITALPSFCVKSATITHGTNSLLLDGEEGLITHADMGETSFSFNNTWHTTYGDFTPKNKKLFTSPFYNFVVVNNSGDEAVYNIEDFENPSIIKFKAYGNISVNPSVTLIPQKYKNVDENYPAGISIRNFPQISYNTDTYKLWLAKNQGSQILSYVGSGIQIASGIATAIATKGAGMAIGGAQAVSGVMGVLDTFNRDAQAQKEPNGSHAGSPQNDLLTALGKNKFDFYYRRLKAEYAKTIDAFFTMYGYQTNKLKVPNISSRPAFNYVQTNDCNIKGSIPANDMRAMKAMFNNGVTFWKP